MEMEAVMVMVEHHITSVMATVYPVLVMEFVEHTEENVENHTWTVVVV